MKVTRLFPRNKDDGSYLEDVAIFAARRCRTTKDFDALWSEVISYSEDKSRNFLNQVVFTDWAADVLEMQPLIYDVEGVPVWLVIEMLRHRLMWRDFSMEQLSQRAINPAKLVIKAPTPALQDLVDEFVTKATALAAAGQVPPEQFREVIPQGVLVNLVIGSNLRAFHHFWFMRSSEAMGGKGGAHPLFMEMADKMQKIDEH